MFGKFFIIVRIATGILLSILFALNSWVIFQHYIEGKTVTSSDIVTSPRGTQLLPAIIICREKPYEGEMDMDGGPDRFVDMLRLENFLNKALKLHYMILDHDGNSIYDNLMYEEIDWKNATIRKPEQVYSFKQGHCVVLKYIQEVRAAVPACNKLCYRYSNYYIT